MHIGRGCILYILYIVGMGLTFTIIVKPFTQPTTKTHESAASDQYILGVRKQAQTGNILHKSVSLRETPMANSNLQLIAETLALQSDARRVITDYKYCAK